MRTQVEIDEAYEEGRFLLRSFNKNVTVTTTVGVGQDLSGVSGNPVAQYFLGSSGESTEMSYLLNDKGIDCGGSMPGYSKFIHRIEVLTTTTNQAPCTLKLMDYLMFYPFIGMDTGLQNLTQSATLPRYSANEGVQMMLIEQNPYIGNVTCQVGYTNQDGVSGRLTPIFSLNTAVVAGTVATSAPTTSGAAGLFLPLQSGDYGVQQADTIEFFSGDVGTVCILLCVPIATIPIYEVGTYCYFDLWNNFGYLPKIKDDAYLNFIMQPSASVTGAVTNTIHGNITTIWKQN
nr:hypothetical protein [uncultured Flavobacterium sp.]